MRTALGVAQPHTPPVELLSGGQTSAAQLGVIVQALDDAKAENVVSIDLKGKSSIGDFMIVASGRFDRHVGAIAEQVQQALKTAGAGHVHIEGLQTCDWVLIDTGDIIVHVFRPEVREFYNLEKMWLAERPGEPAAH